MCGVDISGCAGTWTVWPHSPLPCVPVCGQRRLDAAVTEPLPWGQRPLVLEPQVIEGRPVTPPEGEGRDPAPRATPAGASRTDSQAGAEIPSGGGGGVLRPFPGKGSLPWDQAGPRALGEVAVPHGSPGGAREWHQCRLCGGSCSLGRRPCLQCWGPCPPPSSSHLSPTAVLLASCPRGRPGHPRAPQPPRPVLGHPHLPVPSPPSSGTPLPVRDPPSHPQPGSCTPSENPLHLVPVSGGPVMVARGPACGAQGFLTADAAPSAPRTHGWPEVEGPRGGQGSSVVAAQPEKGALGPGIPFAAPVFPLWSRKVLVILKGEPFPWALEVAGPFEWLWHVPGHLPGVRGGPAVLMGTPPGDAKGAVEVRRSHPLRPDTEVPHCLRPSQGVGSTFSPSRNDCSGVSVSPTSPRDPSPPFPPRQLGGGSR